MKKLVLIHGALGSGKEFKNIIPLLQGKFEVFNYELPHHGEKRESELPFTVENLADDLLMFLEKKGKCIIYGFSLGGYVSLSAASKDDRNIEGIITQGTKMDWSPEVAAKEIKSLDEEFLKEKALPFYDYLKDLHGSYLKDLLTKTASLMLDLGDKPVLTSSVMRAVNVPVRMTRGGKDRMVSKEETINAVKYMSEARYFEIPHLPHPIGFIKPKKTARLIEVQAKSLNYRWAQTSFGEMSYQTFGDLSDETYLLFLHEAIGSIAQWKEFPELLANELNLPAIVPEFPGYGFSEADDTIRDANYLHNFSLQVLPDFIKTICPSKQLIIVGHSDGGTNALLYSSKFPENVKGIVTMAAHYINEEVTREGIRPAIEAFEEGKLKGLEFYHGKKTEHLFYNWARTWLQDDFKNWDITNDIKDNSTPALIIQGDDDQYGTDQQVLGIAEQLDNAQTLFIDSCGHTPHLEQQDIVIKEIKKWKERLN